MVKPVIAADYGDFEDGEWETGLDIGPFKKKLTEEFDMFATTCEIAADEEVRSNLRLFRDSLAIGIDCSFMPDGSAMCDGDIVLEIRDGTDGGDGSRIASCTLKEAIDELVEDMSEDYYGTSERAAVAKNLLAAAARMVAAADKIASLPDNGE